MDRRMNAIRISSIRFHNFKSLQSFSISLHEINILAGANNSGKSTVISAIRILEIALRKARSKNAAQIKLPGDRCGWGHRINIDQSGVSLENVSTNYNDQDSWIDFRISNGNLLGLYFPPDGGCVLYWETTGPLPVTAGKFAAAFPLEIRVVPVLGPLEHNEPHVLEDTVVKALATHRASRHFRNYWRYNPAGWDEFASLVAKTWPGMEINKPELDSSSRTLAMFAAEDRILREVYWSGFGFQIWCQLLTHVASAQNCTLLAIDEPEIYLHPDVQRQLLGILRDVGADVLLATHSVEILGEADPSEILLIDKRRNSALRLKDIEGVQAAISAIGSVQNVTLAHLARTRKILFVEGMDDFKTIRRFAKRLEMDELAGGLGITPFESGGFSSWERVKSYAWGVKSTIDSKIRIYAIYDRDYYCSEEISAISGKLGEELSGVRFLERKEMENYLLDVNVLTRLVDKQLEARKRRTGSAGALSRPLIRILDDISDRFRVEVYGQRLAKELEYRRSGGLDVSTVAQDFMRRFEEEWRSLDSRLKIVPGKQVLRALRDAVQNEAGISLTLIQIVDEYRTEEIPADMKDLVATLDVFRSGKLT
jgi:energy-coupling factor transporter ATP-binding protein EcfA2